MKVCYFYYRCRQSVQLLAESSISNVIAFPLYIMGTVRCENTTHITSTWEWSNRLTFEYSLFILHHAIIVSWVEVTRSLSSRAREGRFIGTHRSQGLTDDIPIREFWSFDEICRVGYMVLVTFQNTDGQPIMTVRPVIEISGGDSDTMKRRIGHQVVFDVFGYSRRVWRDKHTDGDRYWPRPATTSTWAWLVSILDIFFFPL